MLGLGPGIDYGAVGEAMAMAAVMKSARQAQANAEGGWRDAMEIVAQQRELIKEYERQLQERQQLAAMAASLGQANGVEKVVAHYETKLARAARHQDIAERHIKQLEGEARAAREAREDLFEAIKLVCVHEAGLRDMAIALEEALRAAVPDHPLLAPTGEAAADGRAREKGDDVYDAGARAQAKALDVPYDRESAMGRAMGAIEAVRDRAQARRASAPSGAATDEAV